MKQKDRETLEQGARQERFK